MWLKWFFLCSWLCKRSFPHSILIIIHLTWILDWKRLDITGVYILLATMCMFSTLAFPLWAISPASFDPYLLIQCLLTTSISSRNHFLPRTSAGGTWVCLYTRDMFHFRTTRTLIFSSNAHLRPEHINGVRFWGPSINTVHVFFNDIWSCLENSFWEKHCVVKLWGLSWRPRTALQCPPAS